jgi:predicted naringenin-chalcone synthase
LFIEVAEKLLKNSRFEPKDITHLVTVSCTGFYAPGPDFDIIQSLELNSSIERYHLGFMGCYASIPALKMARQFCQANENATVLVVSVELCSIHFQANTKMDNLLSSTVFADGAAGAIVSNKNPETQTFRLDGFASSINKKGSDDMAWSIGDTGFNMILSNYIPDLLKNGMDDFLADIMNQFNINQNSTYGNMSSATILFVLKELLGQPADKTEKKTLAMSFGPGLTLESALLSKIIP